MFISHKKYGSKPEVGDTVITKKPITISHGVFEKGHKFILLEINSGKCKLADIDTGFIVDNHNSYTVDDGYHEASIFLSEVMLSCNPSESQKIYDKKTAKNDALISIKYSCPNFKKTGCNDRGLCKLKIDKPILSDCKPEFGCMVYLSDEDKEKNITLKNKYDALR